MRNAMSRYTGVGTYHHSMSKGKILTYPVAEFRKLLKFTKEENIWWRDQVEAELSYELLSDLGLDFNREKLYQSGFEFRSFDEFPASYLPEVLHSIVLICEHSRHIENIAWATDSIVWNNLVFRALKEGYQATLSQSEKQNVLEALQLTDLDEAVYNTINRLDEFFFAVLKAIHQRYTADNTYVQAFLGELPQNAPRWENFNEHQTKQHAIQLHAIS